jgi:hypothetical protein
MRKLNPAWQDDFDNQINYFILLLMKLVRIEPCPNNI